MADKIVIEAEVKSNIGDVSKDAKSAAAEFQVMGVSLNSVKAGFVSAGKSAKVMFGSIKAGLMSTGIGALLIAVGSLVTFFTKTKKGAELLEVAFAGIGAAVSVIVDRVSKFGGGIVKLFKGDVKGALTDVKGAFTGIGTEIANDVKQAVALEKAFVALRDIERELNVETAQRRADIEELKLIAEDVTKTEKERLEAAEKAFKIENDLLNKRVANAEEAVRIQTVQNGLNESMDEDLDALAQKEIELANIRGESVTKQIELNNKINAIKQETINKNEQIRIQNQKEFEATQNLLKDLEILRQEDEFAKKLLALKNEEEQAKADAKLIESREERNKQLGLLDEIYFEKYLDLVDNSVKITVDGNKKEVESTEDTTEARLAAFSGLANALSGLAGDNKELAAAGAIIDTYAGANKAFAQGGVAGFVTGAAIIAAGLNNVNRIYSTPVAGGGGGAGGGGAAATPAPQMMSGAFELSGGVEPEPTRAYVVTDEMTNSQNQLANIRRRATI